MAAVHNWFPGKRAGVIAMARAWLATITTRATNWNIPQTEVTELSALIQQAETALAAVQTAERSQVSSAGCRAAFDALETKMRYLKKHFFLEPPLTEADFITLLLKPPDTTKSEIPPPDLEGEGDVKFPDFGIIEVLNIRARGVITDQRSYDAVRIYFALTGTPTPEYSYRLSETPQAGFQLPYSIRTRRKKHRFEFPGESGNRIYVCLRWQNGKGQEGPWGPIMTAIVP